MAHGPIQHQKDEVPYEPTWSDTVVDILKRSLFSSEKESDNISSPGDYGGVNPNIGQGVDQDTSSPGTYSNWQEPSIQWSDAGDIWENFWKKSASRAVDFPLKPFEYLSGRDLSADIGVPGVEDWGADYRPEFEEGPYGWLRHLDKASYGSGIASTLAAYYGLGRVAPTAAGIAYPAFRYFDKLSKMNKAYRLKKAADTGVLPKDGGILNAIKDFFKVGGQSIVRPIRHGVNPKRWSKKFDKYPYTSHPERNLFGNVAAKTAILGGADVVRSLVRDAKAGEIDTPRGIETAYPDRIMRMANQPKLSNYEKLQQENIAAGKPRYLAYGE